MKTFFERFIQPPFQFKHGNITSVVDLSLKELYTYPSIFAGCTSLFEQQQHSIKVNNRNEHFITGNWKKISASKHFTLGITTDNQLYGWGVNTHGQLMHDPKTHDCLKTPTLLLDNVCDVAVGFNHTVIVVKENDVFVVKAFGDNLHKQISKSDTPSEHTPVRISGYLTQPNIFACGNQTGIAFNFCTEILGDNTYLQIPLDEENEYVIRDYNLVSIGVDNIFLVDRQNNLYGIGKNDVYQLGLNHNNDTTFADLQNCVISNTLKASTIHSSKNGTVIVDEKNNIYTWGKCIDNVYQIPTQILEDDEWYQAVSGDSFIAALNTDGYTYCLGSIDEPQDLE